MNLLDVIFLIEMLLYGKLPVKSDNYLKVFEQAFLWFKSIDLANKAAREQDQEDGFYD